jgi:hypothetical protein
MKIYLASVAIGNEACRKEGMLPINRRLLSFYHIISPHLLNNDSIKVFTAIKKLKEEQYENQQIGVTGRPGKGKAWSRKQGDNRTGD